MTQPPREGTADHTDYTPDFELPRHGAIREDNWSEYEAKGFEPVPGSLNAAQSLFGVEHIYTGDAYDFEAGRPLHHQPGVGVYVDPEGRELAAEKGRRWREQRQREAHQSEGDPGSS